MSVLQDLFSSGKKVGLDIGQSAVKACELNKSGKKAFSLKSFNFSSLSESAIFEETINNRSEIVTALKSTFSKGKFSSKQISFGLSGTSCVVKTMQAPEGSNEEIEDYINWEAEQFIPFGIENAEISLHIMPSKGEDTREVVMAAAKIQDLETYDELISAAGLKIKIVDLQVLSIINAFEYNYSDYIEEYRKGTLIIDLGSQTTKIIVYKNGLPIMTKSILIGGVNATEEIQKEIGLDFGEAEDLKMGSEEGGYPDEVLKAIERTVKKIVESVVDTVSFYNTSGAQDRIYNCFITGGSLSLPGIVEGLAERLNLSIEILDPLRKVAIKGRLSPAMKQYITYCGTVAIGLAMRNFD